MKVSIKNFGTTLSSRQMGKEALAALRPLLASLPPNERIELNFAGVVTFSPSWGDEFLTPLLKEYGERLILHHTDNPSVRATVEFLEEVNKIDFQTA